MLSRIFRAIPILVLLLLPLAPGALFAQAFGISQEMDTENTKFEVTYSGFKQVSEVGENYVYSIPLTQEVQTLGLLWDLYVKGFVFRTGVEEIRASKDLGSIQAANTISERMFRITYVDSKYFAPYIGVSQNLMTSYYHDAGVPPALPERMVETTDDMQTTLAGFTTFFRFSDWFVPFLGYAQSRETFSIFALDSIFTGQTPSESYDLEGTFVEGGIMLGSPKGLHASWVVKKRDVPGVAGTIYNFGGLRQDSQEVTLGLGDPKDNGLQLGYSTVVQERSIDNFFYISRMQDTATLKFRVDKIWLIKVAQSQVSSTMDFLLSSPIANTTNHYTQNSLTLVWQF